MSVKSNHSNAVFISKRLCDEKSIIKLLEYLLFTELVRHRFE